MIPVQGSSGLHWLHKQAVTPPAGNGPASELKTTIPLEVYFSQMEKVPVSPICFWLLREKPAFQITK